MTMKLLVSGSTQSVAAITKHRERFNANAFTKLCLRAEKQPRLLWVACPDVVGDAAATLRQFRDWVGALNKLSLPIAFVAQDGLTSEQTPWDEFGCLFLGGSTEWKLSHAAEDLAHEAKDRGKWVHMGRVNSLRRMKVAQLFKCDSVDGSSASRFGDTYIAQYLAWLQRLSKQRILREVAR
jgi:hypothetical protein